MAFKKTKKDVLFFGSPIHFNPELQNLVITLGEDEGEIPNGTIHIASYLENKNISSLVIPMDPFLKKAGAKNIEEFKTITEKVLEEKIKQYDPKIIGFELMYTFNSQSVIEMTRWAKKYFPKKIIVVGGNHATFSSDFLLNPKNKTGIDIVVKGEGEWTMAELVKKIKMGKRDLSTIKGISYRKNDGKVIENKPRERGDLYNTPPINYSLIEIPSGIKLSMFNHAVMFVRACKGNCTFCTSPKMWKREITQKNIRNFEHDIKYLVKHNVTHISVWDDDILVTENSFKQIMKVLTKVKKSHPNVVFYVQTRVEHLRNEKNPDKNLELIKKAGIQRVFLGIESGSQTILNAMRKGYKLEWIVEACRNLKKHKIEVGAFLIVGHPGSTPKEEQKSLKFIKQLFEEKLIDDMQCHVLSPLPGTDVIYDPRLKINEHSPVKYSIINNYPVFDLINPQTGEIIFSKEQIWESYNKLLKLRQHYLGLSSKSSNKLRI